MTGGRRWEAGQTFGPDRNPEQYRLLDFIHRGGEGEVWQAERADRDGTRDLWAVKILSPFDGDGTPEETARWQARWDDSVSRANQLSQEGIVVPLCFEWAAPRFPHLPPHPGGGTVPYMVSRWVEGLQLDAWAQQGPASPVERLDVLVRLCRTVDRLHDSGWVHRDISHANVLVDRAGEPHLIDLTFLARVGRPLTVPVSTEGYAIGDEEQRDRPPSPAKDCFAVGALARLLLVPHLRVPETVRLVALAGEQVEEAGFGAEAADWLLRALALDPAHRPRPLTPWAERLRDLVARGPGPRIGCLALAVDAHDQPVAVPAGPQGPAVLTGSPAPAGRGRPPALPGAPRGVRQVALARDGLGALVIAAVDRYDVLWLGTATAGWEQAAHGVRGVAAATSPFGEALFWTSHRTGLRLLRVPPGGAPVAATVPDGWPSRVLTAAWDELGRPAVLVSSEQRVTHWTWPLEPGAEPEPVTVCARPVGSGALALNRWGELTAWLLDDRGQQQRFTRHFSGVWESDTPATPGIDRIALLSIRQGAVRASAGPRGLTVESEPSRAGSTPLVLCDQPATLPALAQGRDGRLFAAALVGPEHEAELRCWQEDWDGSWLPVDLRPA
ncbi:serine/threonine protein kinase [Kitasatospora sp. NPDC050543]|uniref:serine/threonine protein kinase n=1 Tax=Kitasatospora sp. NPDC050543 TaxID=3364054 RepID=UPI0037908025